MEQKWVWRSEREPDSQGYYGCVRSGVGRRPSYEDICGYDPETKIWTNLRGTVIKSVLMWMEGTVDP